MNNNNNLQPGQQRQQLEAESTVAKISTAAASDNDPGRVAAPAAWERAELELGRVRLDAEKAQVERARLELDRTKARAALELERVRAETERRRREARQLAQARAHAEKEKERRQRETTREARARQEEAAKQQEVVQIGARSIAIVEKWQKIGFIRACNFFFLIFLR